MTHALEYFVGGCALGIIGVAWGLFWMAGAELLTPAGQINKIVLLEIFLGVAGTLLWWFGAVLLFRGAFA